MSAASLCHRIDAAGHPLDERVLHTLRRSPWVGRQIHVEMVEGAVILRGSVRSYFHKQMAQESLLPLIGGSRVLNKLVVAAN